MNEPPPDAPLVPLPALPLVVPPPVLLVVPVALLPLVALGTPPVADGTPPMALGTCPGSAGTDGTVGPAPVVGAPDTPDVLAVFPGTVKPAVPLVTGGVTTTVPVPPVEGGVVESVAGGVMARTAPPPASGSTHVTSRFEQKSGIVVRAVEASAAWVVDNGPVPPIAAIATNINLGAFIRASFDRT